MSHDLRTRLLVVDDEQSIRRLCMTIGTTLGFVCAEAESAEIALRAWIPKRPICCSPT